MKKIEIAEDWVQRHLDIFACPICGQPIEKIDQQQLVCVNQHRINFNKHGYLYLLNHGESSEYDREMLSARRQMLDAGLFLPIVKTIAQQIGSRPQRILDVGCGEGTPLYQLANILADPENAYVGFDISRAGIQLATQLDPQLFFCLADLRALPFQNESFDTIIDLFSPSDYQEFDRVLKAGGQVIKVIPDNDYLPQLRACLYDEDDPHRHYSNQSVKERFLEHYPKAEVKPMSYDFKLPSDLRHAMVMMSPLHWGSGAHQLTNEDYQRLDRVTVNVNLLLAKK
ncbi:methyltransferase domain-containing protein [Limosilactobacillus secaliphilus]|uniref:rRNA methyltransferase n=1 Tax=Limosilactobacillus secaliphilus TaxID=396268 RepID=A0A0R2I7X6_9LACO|nr:methyltransferase domain-containing protein [Limosilactobacillus secaliphilus]KRN58677.1 rRNA methyltransferase [Limosilactobacillus secaliphilus]